MKAWFGSGLVGVTRFDHRQILDYEGLRGRLESSSYAPPKGHPRHEPMMATLQEVFARGALDGRVSLEYDTRVFAGRIA